MKNDPSLPHEPTEAEIQHQAYLLWLEGGCREDSAVDDWHAAKELIRHRHGRSTGRTKRKPAAPASVAAR